MCLGGGWPVKMEIKLNSVSAKTGAGLSLALKIVVLIFENPVA